MQHWRSYPKVYNLGHPNVEEIFEDDVIVEEKVDGSQISFARFGDELKIRSKGREFHIEAPDNMFQEAADTVKSLFKDLKDGYVYRGEYLKKSQHNVLQYARIPRSHIVIFDISPRLETYLSYEEKVEEAARIGLETVPIIYKGRIETSEKLFSFLDETSFLGGQFIEGVVVKNYNRFGKDGKVLLGKYVSEKFKEVHKKEWKKANPSSGDVITQLCDMYCTEARWEKALIHLKERGEIEHSPRDIGKLMKEVNKDIDEECHEEIKQILYKWARKKILRSSTRGLPDWYKQRLVERSFK